MPLIRFNGNDIRNRLRGLRIAFVGDSMGRTQWESFICLLMADISNKSSVYEVNGNRITKKAPYLAVRFSTFNFTVEYYRSPYLIQEGPPPRHVPRRVRRILRLDKVETTEMKWLQANILIFNTGHWWTASKTFARYFGYFCPGEYYKKMCVCLNVLYCVCHSMVMLIYSQTCFGRFSLKGHDCAPLPNFLMTYSSKFLKRKINRFYSCWA